MAVFRVEKNKGYTVMSNHHLRNDKLSLKAKGLLSQMLSLPDTWDYTLHGLSRINKESIDAIRTAIWELEDEGYITRAQGRDATGKLTPIVYTIYEQPQEQRELPLPLLENPTSDKPLLEKPTSDNPSSENPTQINKEILSTNLPSTQEKSKERLNTDSIPFLSPYPSPAEEAAAEPPERKRKEQTDKANEAYRIYREIILDNISYDILVHDRRINKELLDEIVDLIVETVCSSRKRIRIAGDDYPAELVKSKFLKLDCMHIEFVAECLHNNTTAIRNIKKYMLAVLFNAPSTIDSYYTALVAHDMANGFPKKKSGIPDYSCDPDESL